MTQHQTDEAMRASTLLTEAASLIGQAEAMQTYRREQARAELVRRGEHLKRRWS